MRISAFRLAFFVALSGLLAFVAGCFSMEAAPLRGVHTLHGAPTRHVAIANNGWYLFNAWPLACGNARENATFRWRFFSDEVNIDLLQERLTRYAARENCDVTDLIVNNDEQVLLSIPFTSIAIPIPYVLTFRETQLSCVLVKRQSPAAGGAQ